MNLYGMDPAQNPKTPAFVICNDVNDKEHAYEETKGQINLEGACTDVKRLALSAIYYFNADAERLYFVSSYLGYSLDISDLGFDAKDASKGLSYVETGPNCWVDLYSKPHFSGLHLQLGPNQIVNLAFSPSGDWSDKTKSLQTHKLAGDVAFLLKASSSGKFRI